MFDAFAILGHARGPRSWVATNGMVVMFEIGCRSSANRDRAGERAAATRPCGPHLQVRFHVLVTRIAESRRLSMSTKPAMDGFVGAMILSRTTIPHSFNNSASQYI
jgi:hypothetical protein